MAKTLPQEAAAPQAAVSDTQYQKQVDRWTVAGAIVAGTFVLGLPGLLLLGYAYRLHKKGVAEGRQLRPIMVTLIAILTIIDVGVNFLVWGLDTFPTHDTFIGKSIIILFGKLTDGAYYLGLNKASIGGAFLPSEKAYQIAAVTMLYPMRLGAAIGFLKMKRWGFQFLVVTTWMYAFFWVGYLIQISLQFEIRLGTTLFGLTGYIVANVPYMYPFLLIPYLHTVNRELWSE